MDKKGFLLSVFRENLGDLRVEILFNAETAEKDAEARKGRKDKSFRDSSLPSMVITRERSAGGRASPPLNGVAARTKRPVHIC